MTRILGWRLCRNCLIFTNALAALSLVMKRATLGRLVRTLGLAALQRAAVPVGPLHRQSTI